MDVAPVIKSSAACCRRRASTFLSADFLVASLKGWIYSAAEEGTARMKRAALYSRVSTYDQNPQTQILDLRQMAAQRGYTIVKEYTDKISGLKAKRPGLDAIMADARRGQFDVVMTWACDRIARSTRHFLEVLDELNRIKRRVRQLQGEHRYRWTAGPSHRRDHRRHRRVGTQLDRREGTRRHAPRPA